MANIWTAFHCQLHMNMFSSCCYHMSVKHRTIYANHMRPRFTSPEQVPEKCNRFLSPNLKPLDIRQRPCLEVFLTSWEKVGPYRIPFWDSMHSTRNQVHHQEKLQKSWEHRVGVQNQQSHPIPVQIHLYMGPYCTKPTLSQEFKGVDCLQRITSTSPFAMIQLISSVNNSRDGRA